MPRDSQQPRTLLERAYRDLDLVGGMLVDASASPALTGDSRAWLEVGDWLLLAARVGAERVFFVNDDPVLIFSSLPTGADEREVLALYRRVWSLARPRCLFLSIGDELRVYALTRPPIAPGDSEQVLQPLEVVQRAGDVAEQLGRFHRGRLESGAAFEDPELTDVTGRADQQLLRDVSAATAALIDNGLAPNVAHALIERAILVRYLEDREVLTRGYFLEIAAQNPRWAATLESEEVVPAFGPSSLFVRCLADKRLTYALFDRLRDDFNGDLFVPVPGERQAVEKQHLNLLRELLQGTSQAPQHPLFLWAYDFSVVPTSLVSTMYELFYHQEVGGRETSTYFTPPQLVEFVLANVLTAETLERQPKVCDPACGSGIFLVEAYRRIVRHEAAHRGRPLSTTRLRELLLSRIAGCDVDESAIRLAAFSLYVSFLNYQSPQDIRSAGPLPRLIQRLEADAPRGPLIVGDAFSPMEGESDQVPREKRAWLPWPRNSFDVVVGNPPWSEPKGSKSLAERWASERGLPVGDRNPSQLFLWRALDLLSEKGVAALLVSAKAMLNTRSTSKTFRTEWLDRTRLEHVVNFSQVRRDFFEQGVAPFMLLRFRRAAQEPNGAVVYESARPVARGRRGLPALARLDRRIVAQASLRARDYLWKTYSAGGHRDHALLARLELEGRLRDLVREKTMAQYGYQRARRSDPGAHPPSVGLRRLRSLATFTSWGPLLDEWFEPVSEFVKRAPDERIYSGRRLLVRRGVSPGFGPHARLETEPLAFRHTTYAVSLNHLPVWQGKVILGTLLSTLGRYWLYMVSGSWGTWKDEVRSEELLHLPLRLSSAGDPVTRRITAVVDALSHVTVPRGDLWSTDAGSGDSVASILLKLDDAVADLFELTDAERDLVADFWAGQRANAFAPVAEQALERGTAADLGADASALERYLKVFLAAWNPQLGVEAELGWRVWRDRRAGVIAVVLDTRRRGEDSGREEPWESESWSAALERLGAALGERRAGTLLAHGIVRAVSESAIVVVKRDERRMWTASAAREDADATIAQVMGLQRA